MRSDAQFLKNLKLLSFNETVIEAEGWFDFDTSDITWDMYLRVDMDEVATTYNITWFQMKMFKVGEGQEFVKDKVEAKIDSFMESLLSHSTIDSLTDESHQQPTLEWIPKVKNTVTGEAVCGRDIDVDVSGKNKLRDL